MSPKDLMSQSKSIEMKSELRNLLQKYLETGKATEDIQWESITTENGLPHNWIYDLFQASEGKIYVGTWGGGLAVFDGTEWKTYTKKDGLHDNAVTCIREDKHARIWVATDNGLNYLQDDKIKDGGLAGKSLLNITIDQQDSLWAGCWRAAHSGGGLFCYDGSGWRSYTTRDGLPGQEILKVFEDSGSRIWVGTYEHGIGAGVGCFDGSHWQNFRERDGLAEDCVYSMFEDPSNNLWFGTVGGISVFDGKKWHQLTKKDGLIDNRVYCMWIDSKKKMWFGTEKGLSRFDGENWTSYTKDDGLVENLVRAILETKNGDLWIGTYPYLSGKGGISVARFDSIKRLKDSVMDLLPEPPKSDQLPPGL